MELLRAQDADPRRGADSPLDPGIPVVQMLHIDYDAEGKTLQVADDLFAADRHELAFVDRPECFP